MHKGFQRFCKRVFRELLWGAVFGTPKIQQMPQESFAKCSKKVRRLRFETLFSIDLGYQTEVGSARQTEYTKEAQSAATADLISYIL